MAVTPKKRRNTRERDKDAGRFVKTGTDKVNPKGTSISELDRPERYKPRQPKPAPEPTPEPTPEPAPQVEPQPAPEPVPDAGNDISDLSVDETEALASDPQPKAT